MTCLPLDCIGLIQHHNIELSDENVLLTALLQVVNQEVGSLLPAAPARGSS